MASTALAAPDQTQETAPQEPINDGSQCECEDFGEIDVLADDTELQKAVMDLAKHFAGLDKYARRSEVIEARRQRFYRRGDQYINWSPALFNFIPYPDPGNATNGAPGTDTPRYTDVYNIYWPYMRALISVGCQNLPGVNFEPDRPTEGKDIAAARAAETFRHFFDRVNQRKKIQADIMENFCTDGRTVGYVRTVRDALKLGLDEQGQPNSAEMCDIKGVLETKVCPITEDDPSKFIAFFISDEIEINLAKQTYPRYAKNIQQGSSAVGESAYERMARIGVLQGTRVLQQAGEAFAHLATRHRFWCRPAAFNHAPDSVKQQLKDKFPHGMKLVTCGEAYCGSYDQALDDHIVVSWPAPGDGACKPSMMKDMVPVQDAYNDYRNLEKEIFDFTIPETYVDSAAIGDVDAFRERTAEPGNVVPMTRADSTPLSDAFFVPPPPNSPPSLVAAYQDLMGAFSQFVTGAQPALFGGSDEHNETKGGIAMLRDQAMGQFSICWGALQELMAGVYKRAAMCRANAIQGEQKLSVSLQGKRGRSTVATINVADLQKGNFHAYPDTDSSFPETTGSKRQTVTALVSQAFADPTAIQAWGVLEPANMELQRELLGINDWVIPAANASDKQMQEIEVLLKTRPTPNVAAIQQHAADVAIKQEVVAKGAEVGLPPPDEPDVPDPKQLYTSSVPVDIEWDFHAFEFQTIKDWLSSPDGLQEAKTNPWGILNVKLHGKEHEAALALQAPAPQPIPIIPPKPMMPGQPGAMNGPAPTGLQ